MGLAWFEVRFKAEVLIQGPHVLRAFLWPHSWRAASLCRLGRIASRTLLVDKEDNAGYPESARDDKEASHVIRDPNPKLGVVQKVIDKIRHVEVLP